jgi:hypothetical protein
VRVGASAKPGEDALADAQVDVQMDAVADAD